MYNCTMIDKRLIAKCSHLLMYNLGGLTEVSKCRGVLGNINWYGAMTPEQKHFLTNWYAMNEHKLDWMRL